MNVIISNKYQEMLAGLDIDIIKSLNGEFEVDELISNFSNFFFNKMILDITSIKNYHDLTNLQKLSMALDMSKVILLLDDSTESSTTGYLSKIISMGIYNFTKSVDNIKFLIDNPNSYKDVAHYHQLNTPEPIQNQGALVNDFIKNDLGERTNSTVIGFKNITYHAGATSLVYMLKKQLSKHYKTAAIEVNKTDFMFFNDPELISTTQEDLKNALFRVGNAEITLVDLNDTLDSGKTVCNEVICLIEPSTIQLNKMIRKDKGIFSKLKGSKIVLNKSLLDKKDIKDFEYESRSEVFFNIPPLDDKVNSHKILDDFMSKLGFIRGKNEEDGGNTSVLKGLFRK